MHQLISLGCNDPGSTIRHPGNPDIDCDNHTNNRCDNGACSNSRTNGPANKPDNKILPDR